MTNKAAISFFTAFVVTIVLLAAFDSPVFAQRDRTGRAQLSPEAASQAEALFKNALLSVDNKESESTRQQLQQAMRLWVQLREPGKAAKAAIRLGDRYKQVGKYPDALNCYRLALETESLPGAVRATALNAIAIVYAELYAQDLAERYFKQALDEGRKVSDLQAQIRASTGLAELYYQRREFEKAMNLLTQVRILVKKNHAEADPDVLSLMGRLSLDRGEVGNAKAALVDSLLIYRNNGNVAGQVAVLCAMSSLFQLTGQNQAALEQAEQAVKLADEQAKGAATNAADANARRSRWRPRICRARAERALGQRKRAIRSYGEAIHHVAGMWWAFYIATETSAVAFKEEVQAAYRECVDLLMEDEQFKEAYELAEEAKGRISSGAGRITRRSGDSQYAATPLDLSRSIASLRTQLRASRLSREKQARLRKELDDTEFKTQETRLQAEMENSSDRLVWSQLANAEPLQKRMAEDQMTLAQFSFGEKRSFVWLFANGDFSFEYLMGREEIEKEVRQYLDLLATAPSNLHIERDLRKVREQSEALFAHLFGRLSSQIKPGRPLIIVPDGLLGYLPFETLIHNGHFLVQDHEISYVPSASRIMQPQTPRAETGTGDRLELLAFGDPIFGPERNAFATENSSTGRSFQLPELPRTRVEVQNIAKLFPPGRTRLYVGKDSTEDALKRESLHRYRRLHFATHSLIDERSANRSAVVLTLDADPDEDGLLEVREIAALDLDCDLVVLSACRTGRGQLLTGEGIVGLSRAFLYAGAGAVVVSLWNVSDISTGQLMESFYRYLTAGLGNAAALRETKLQMLKNGKETRHPYYWSSFVIIGKP